ncbi:LAGLIDADG endonuclease [Nodularia sp. NIES-3585]|uniref:LAGLIDADG endonuclease n=1 Tax=Nodularia sp. NIES-3585 TaxID=1973477 RepID=UPI000B5C944F|nr:LAGLIDADG endonuclease [Nodularia sp. NIES-3585]GAX37927.1 hypothetical protein NIES3585_39730 [Nodularia sp. NIES-3585]
MIDTKVDSKPRCVICGEMIVLHSHYRKEHQTCRRYECMKTYRKQHASELDINRRAAQRTVKEQNDVEMVACAVCGERFQIIQHTHLRRHELTLAQYKQEFPFAPLMTDKMKECRGKGSVSKSRYLDYPGKQPDNYLFEFLTGALLGDGSLEKQQKKINARYAEGGNNELYLKWKHNLLEQYFPCSWKEKMSSPHTQTGKRYHGWWLKTTVHPLLTEWHSKWYVEGRKIVPQSLVEKYLTEFALAVWFCDDGHSSKCVLRSYLYTMAFSPEEVRFLSEFLQLKFGLKNRIIGNKNNQLFLSFSGAASDKIRKITRGFSLPGMDYKSHEIF